MALDYSNMKSKAMASRQSRQAVGTGLYRCKLQSLNFDSTQKGAVKVVAEWLVLDGVETDKPIDTQRNKKFNMSIIQEGKGSEFGRAQFSELLDTICTPLNIDIDQYSTMEDLKVLFLELNAHVIIMWIRRKRSQDGLYVNNYTAKEPRGYVVPAIVPPAAVAKATTAPAAKSADTSVELVWAKVNGGAAVKMPLSEVPYGSKICKVGEKTWTVLEAPEEEMPPEEDLPPDEEAPEEEAPAEEGAPEEEAPPAEEPPPAAIKPAGRKRAALFGAE